MFVLPKTLRLGVNTISHQTLVGERRPMSHGRAQLCPQNGQCQRLMRGPGHGGFSTPAPWGLCPQDWGAAGDHVVVPPPVRPWLCHGMLTCAKRWDCSSVGCLCSLWAVLHWWFSSCFSCMEYRATSSLLSEKL